MQNSWFGLLFLTCACGGDPDPASPPARVGGSGGLAGAGGAGGGGALAGAGGSLSPPPDPEHSYYVDVASSSCSDDGPGTKLQPFCTLNQALVVLVAGDIAHVAPGTYDIASGPHTDNALAPFEGQVVARPAHDGSAEAPIWLLADSSASQIIGAGNEVNDDDGQVFITNGMLLIDRNYWVLDGFYSRDGGGIGARDNQGFVLRNSLVFVDPRTDSGLVTSPRGGSGLLLYRSHSALIERSEIWSINLDAYRLNENEQTETRATLVTVYDSNDVTLRDSLVYGGRNNLQSAGDSSGCVMEGNLVMHGQEHLGMLCNENFQMRRNVFYPTGQQAPYINASCSSATRASGVFENNTNIGLPIWAQTHCPSDPSFDGADHILYRNNLVQRGGGPSASCFYSGPEFSDAIDSDYNACAIWKNSDSSVAAGGFWAFWSYDDATLQWIADHTKSPYSLAEWQQQADKPFLVQDPHSLHHIDPLFGTPHAKLGQLENADYACVQSLGPGFPKARSNCKPPFRMRVLDDLSLTPGSPLIDAGDPTYSPPAGGGARVDIGAVEYGAPPPFVLAPQGKKGASQ